MTIVRIREIDFRFKESNGSLIALRCELVFKLINYKII